jgi:hypothetical protein
MIRAIIRHGHIEPLDRLPEDWPEGQEVTVEVSENHSTGEAIRDWHAEWKAACPDISAEDHVELDEALATIRQLGKDQMRKEMGL